MSFNKYRKLGEQSFSKRAVVPAKSRCDTLMLQHALEKDNAILQLPLTMSDEGQGRFIFPQFVNSYFLIFTTTRNIYYSVSRLVMFTAAVNITNLFFPGEKGCGCT